MAIRLKLPPGTLSYPNFKEPRKVGDADKATYSCVVIFEEGTDLSELEAACLAVAEERWGRDKVARMHKAKAWKWPIKDGDEYAAKKDGADAYEGKIYVNLKSEEQPGMVGPRPGPDGKAERYEANQFYPGCLVRVSVSAYAFDHPKGGKGVGLGLNNVQFLRHGTRLDNRKSAAEDFEPIEEDEYEDEDAINPLV